MRWIFILAVLITAAAAGDAGSGVDPNGATLDHRCTIDPNGGTCTASTLAGDRGAGLDPNG